MTVVSNRAVLLIGFGASLLRRASEVRDDVRALDRVAHREPHLLAGDEALGAREPLVERGFVPHDSGFLDGLRVGITLGAAGFAPEEALVGRAGAVVLQ